MTKLPPLPLLSLLLLLLPISVISQSLEFQRSTLLSIKQQWGNPPSLSSWTPTTSPCSWPGITCSSSSSTAAVTGIALSNANITTQIPPSICDLKNLTTLDLSWNLIPGNFPTYLYNCSSLSFLNLSSNSFVGSIPEDIVNLSPDSLQHLDLSANNFTGNIPKSIDGLKQLRSLNLTMNLLNGTYPSEIGNLSKLEELQLGFNGFAPMALPSEWGKLKNLTVLVMTQCNVVDEIPQSFGGLESLEHLDLAQNEIVGRIPSGLFLLKNLSYLYLFKNELSGEIPSLVEALNLKEIDISQNNLTGSISEDFGRLKQLRVLNLFSNQFHGEIPASIGLLSELEIVKLFYNNFSGPLPPELGLHSQLQTLEIGGNLFSGPLPQNLCYKGAFLGVTAFANNLSGEIPESLGNCTTLLNLMLYNNSFTGEVPQGIWTLPNVYILAIGFNSFTGQLPNHISSSLTDLELNDNKFHGQIPASIASWTTIQVFKAGNNMLSGTVPLGLTSLSKLITLSLEGNQLSASLPTKINSWAALSLLNLARNKLSGSIPGAIGSLPTLNYLDLSSNDLSGEIPYQLAKLELTFLDLSNNKLTGEIPDSLENPAYSNSFLNNTNLCTSDETRILSLSKCSVSLSSSSSKHLSSKHLAIILVLAVIICLVGLYFTLLLIKEMRHKKQRSTLTSWKLTPFQKLDFTEANIIPSLTEHNVIGSGGSGKVYRVPITCSGKLVAVKKIWNNQKLDDSQFLAEVQILGTVRHSNIVKLLCCVSSEKTKLLVYEYLENWSLDRWLHRSRGEAPHVLDWPTRMKVAIGAAQGLCYMHHDCSPPIVHRDVKSSNILLDSEFNAKIADFGLAKMTGKQGELPVESNLAGSFGYLAPECRHMTRANEKMDVYSFGVVLLELATGKEPSGGDECLNLAESSWKHYKDEKPIADAIDDEIEPQCYLEEAAKVFQLGLMCTSASPSSRPSMEEVVRLLRRFSPLESDPRKPKRGASERDVVPLLGRASRGSGCMSGSRRAVQEDDFSMV